MKAIIYSQYGPPNVLAVADVREPSATTGQVRVRVHAASLNPKDVLIRKGRMRMFVARQFPRTPGYDIAGTLLDAAGDLAAGTDVYGMVQANAGGACAEVVALPPRQIARKPSGLSMVEAASIPLAALTALQALRDHLQVQPGQQVLLNGASGGVGTCAVQIAQMLGATSVAVCSGRNEELVRSLGADRVLDYTTDPPARQRGLDCVFDVYGSLPWPRARECLAAGGRYCTTIPNMGSILRTIAAGAGLHRASLVRVRSHREDLDLLRDAVEGGQFRPVVDRVYGMEESADAHAYLETRRARGKVVIRIHA